MKPIDACNIGEPANNDNGCGCACYCPDGSLSTTSWQDANLMRFTRLAPFC
jgi:hypothetical protein